MSPRPRGQEERIRDAMDGKGKLGKPEPEEKSGLSVESFVASLTPKKREELYDVLVDYSYRDFEDEEGEPEEAEEQ